MNKIIIMRLNEWAKFTSFPLFYVEFRMFTFIFKQLQIFRSIIVSNTVNMMHNFFGFKIAANHLFHNKVGMMNASTFITKRMFTIKNSYIPIIFSLPAFPIGIIRRVSIKFFLCFTYFSFMFFGKMFTIIRSILWNTYKFKITFSTSFRSISSQMFLTIYTFFIFILWIKGMSLFEFHITSKLKAAFRFLTETRLRISTLLTAYCEHKNTKFPLDGYSISLNWGLSR